MNSKIKNKRFIGLATFKFFILLFIFVIPFSEVKGQTEIKAGDKLQRPRLVVGIVVDQMRYDYLYRFYDRYGDNGFKRMLKEGFSCENTFINYIPTVTGIGHATVYTGSVPAIHGIAGNDFIDNSTGKTLYCVGDSDVETVGSTSNEGKMSPKNLWSTTIGDELMLATNFRSKVIGIALKDRGAILPAGHSATSAFWFDSATGNFITSTYYMKNLPSWVNKFNKQNLPEKYLKQDWNTLYHIRTYVQSSPDDNEYEGLFEGEEMPVFPKRTSKMFNENYGILKSTPYGNTLTLDMAKATIENEQLGQGEVPDLLAVSLSSTDYVGHKFGVNAIETEDTYLRLDKDLGEFLKYLDTKIGKGNYTVFLTADHGGAHNIKFMTDHKIPSKKWLTVQIQKDLNTLLENAFGVKDVILSMMNSQVHFNYKVINKNKLNEEAIRKICIEHLKTQEDIAYVVDLDNIGNAAVPDEIKKRIVNGYNRDRSGGIQIIPKPARFSTGSHGTSHSAWNPYDAQIPLLWMGWGIPKGETAARVDMTDIAATLATLLKVQQPNGSIGQPITEILSKEK